MAEQFQVFVDGHAVMVEAGTSAAAAIAIAGAGITRRSVGGELRAPLCGMGICQECRVTIDGVTHRLACQTPCVGGMHVITAAASEAA